MAEHDWRAVPMETLRAWVRDESTKDSLRSVAEMLGIGRTTLTNFMDGVGVPHPRIRRTIALAYLRSQNLLPREDGADTLDRLEAAREHLIAANEQDSIRVLASKVGLGSSTLHSFLSGADPQPRTRRKVLDWYAGQLHAAPDRVQSALDMLLEGMSEDEVDDARTDLLLAVTKLYEARGKSPPSWVQARTE
jgi:hypothetical protein